jgi:hypothetical protein
MCASGFYPAVCVGPDPLSALNPGDFAPVADLAVTPPDLSVAAFDLLESPDLSVAALDLSVRRDLSVRARDLSVTPPDLSAAALEPSVAAPDLAPVQQGLGLAGGCHIGDRSAGGSVLVAALLLALACRRRR